MATSAERVELPLDAVPASLSELDGHLLRVIAGGRSASYGPPTRAERNRESRYRRCLDALGVAVYTTDADGRITFYNEAAAVFWGRHPAVGELWCGSLRLRWPDGRPMAHETCPMAVALTENRVVRGGEAVAERPDGSAVSFVAYPTPLRDDDGRLIGAVNVLVDVTERRQAEDALRRAAAELAASNAVKDEFLGLVSHELRTPVTTIFGNARLLHDRGSTLDPDVRAGMVADIAEEADRLQGIIENLLHLTRLGSGQQPELEPQVVSRVVDRAVQGFRRRRPGRVVRITGDRTGEIVDADPTWLEAVVGNLLTNADKYSPPAAPIDLSLRATGDAVEVEVRDRGIGFGETTPEALFEPFYRSPAARSSAEGMGVGLAVCKRIVEALGGTIRAVPREGGGATFTFRLPIAAEAADPA